ncbi:MAG: hypothetical protein E7496_05385 [Ruminococcus sp.]|nr:hypothetical protein [Ruminococcus sp.]
MNYMDELYDAWFPHSKDTPEALAIMNKMEVDKDENYDALIRCICAVSRQGFEAGFDCAVQLLHQ